MLGMDFLTCLENDVAAMGFCFFFIIYLCLAQFSASRDTFDDHANSQALVDFAAYM